MAYFEHTNRQLELLPKLTAEKKLSRFLGTDFLLQEIRRLKAPEIGNFRVGCIFLTIIFGGMGYYFYRQSYKQRMITSNYYYRLINLPPLNAGQQFWWNARDTSETQLFTYYYRMPKKEFNIKYRMRSAYIQGEFDHDKEILIPKEQNGVHGYLVVTPFYYYTRLNPSAFVALLQDGKPFMGHSAERAAIAVYRGWIPASLKDRRLRPHDFNIGKEETLLGTIKHSTIRRHDFHMPNDPTHNLWTNESLEDMALYWNLPNVDDAKHCYFQEVNFDSLDFGKKDVFPARPSIQEAIIQNGKEMEVLLDRNYRGLSIATSSLASLFAYFLYLAA